MKPIEIPESLTAWKRLVMALKGVRPLLMHNPEGMAKLEKAKGAHGGKKYIPTPEEEAGWSTYQLESGELYVSADAVRQSGINGAAGMKIGKLYVTRLIAAGLIIDAERFLLERDGKVLKAYDRIETRGVVVQRNRISRSRALIELPWSLTAEFLIDVNLFRDSRVVIQAFQQAGQTAGLLDYRPNKGGSFGRFEVVAAEIEE